MYLTQYQQQVLYLSVKFSVILNQKRQHSYQSAEQLGGEGLRKGAILKVLKSQRVAQPGELKTFKP